MKRDKTSKETKQQDQTGEMCRVLVKQNFDKECIINFEKYSIKII